MISGLENALPNIYTNDPSQYTDRNEIGKVKVEGEVVIWLLQPFVQTTTSSCLKLADTIERRLTGSHKNVVTRAIDEGDVSDEFEVSFGAFAGKGVFLGASG